MSAAVSTGIRIITALGLALVVQGVLFTTLSNMTNVHFEPKMITSTRIEFTRLKTDTETNSRRRQEPVEQPRVEPLPEVPQIQIASANPDVSIPIFAPNVDMSAALKAVSVAVGTESDVLPLIRIPPVYPRNAKMAKIQGFVRMEVVINPDGSVNDIRVIEATPPRMFDTAAVTAMKQWRFKPKLVNGVAVSQRAQQTIEFKLEG